MGLSLFLGIGGGSISAYSVAVVVVLLSLFLVYLATYPRLRAWAVALPALILFFSARSFGSYLVTVLPAALVAACTTGQYRPEEVADNPPTPGRSFDEPTTGTPRDRGEQHARFRSKPATTDGPWRHWRWIAAGAFLASSIVVGFALTSSSPLSLQIISVRTTGQLATIVEVDVAAHNVSSSPVRPAFSIESGGAITAFWQTSSGPARLAPGQDAHYRLLAPNFFAQPPLSGGFQVVAFTSSPATVSRSASYEPTTWHVSLNPDAVNHIVPVGKPITIHAQLLNSLDSPIRFPGEPIYMGQVTYTQEGLVASKATINGSQPGATPVVAYTNAGGTATFTVQGTGASNNPIYFEANIVNLVSFYPYGYSEILPIRFGP